MKGYEEMQAIGRESIDAAIESVGVWTRGCQAMAAEVAGYSMASFEKSAEAIEATLGARSTEIAVETQAAFAKETCEAFIGEAGKLGEMYLATARDALAPIEKRARKAA